MSHPNSHNWLSRVQFFCIWRRRNTQRVADNYHRRLTRVQKVRACVCNIVVGWPFTDWNVDPARISPVPGLWKRCTRKDISVGQMFVMRFYMLSSCCSHLVLYESRMWRSYFTWLFLIHESQTKYLFHNNTLSTNLHTWLVPLSRLESGFTIRRCSTRFRERWMPAEVSTFHGQKAAANPCDTRA